MDTYSSEFSHFICQWHLLRNIKRNGGYLKKQNQQLFELFMALPYVKQTNQFDENIDNSKSFLIRVYLQEVPEVSTNSLETKGKMG